MRIEDQVCTLEQAKKLKEEGVNQASYFLYNSRGQLMEAWMVEGVEDQFFAAYTIAELGVMLPHPDSYAEYGFWLYPSELDTSEKNPDKAWYCLLQFDGEEGKASSQELCEAPTEAQARAAMLIILLDRSYIQLEEINQRLSA